MRRTLIPLLMAAAMTGCGAPGAPAPPTLRLPAAVQDLRAERVGDRVTLRWTAPRQTSDGVNLKPQWLGPTRVCRSVGAPLVDCRDVVRTISPAEALAAANQPQVFADTVTPELQRDPTAVALYAVEVVNHIGRSAGLSNRATVPVAPTTPPPAAVETEVRADSIVVRFKPAEAEPLAGTAFGYHLIRTVEGTSATLQSFLNVRAGAEIEFADQNFEWGKPQSYLVRPVTVVAAGAGRPSMSVVGEDSTPVTVTPRDTFPPAPPQGVQAVGSGDPARPWVDLTWAPNADKDLAGYNVYRVENGGRTKLTAEPVAIPSFRDEKHASGEYEVTAVDLRGNESAPSEPARAD